MNYMNFMQHDEKEICFIAARNIIYILHFKLLSMIMHLSYLNHQKTFSSFQMYNLIILSV